MKWNDEYDKQIRDLVKRFPKNFARMITSKGSKGRYENRSSLAEYIDSVTPLLADPFYTLKTKVYWVLYRLEDFPKCEICDEPITNWNVKKLKDPYKRFCCQKCQYKSEATQDKIRSTCINRYGVINVFQRKDIIDRIHEQAAEIAAKKYATHKRRHTFKISMQEKTCYEKLLGKFKDVKRQYKSKDYPFLCDFYIPEIDTYVEYQGSWTHGGHLFDADSAPDQEQLERWKAKSTKYYDIAINTWTVRDVRKRETAATNKLNFVELWNMEDFDRWLSEVSSR